MFHLSPARWLAASSALAALAAVAQPASTQPPAPAPAPASAAATEAPPPVLTYKSALDGYRPFADDKTIPWKEANETVYRRGGWQAYAKEASGTAAEAESPKGPAAAPAAQPGHSMPMPAKKEKP